MVQHRGDLETNLNTSRRKRKQQVDVAAGCVEQPSKRWLDGSQQPCRADGPSNPPLLSWNIPQAVQAFSALRQSIPPHPESVSQYSIGQSRRRAREREDRLRAQQTAEGQPEHPQQVDRQRVQLPSPSDQSQPAVRRSRDVACRTIPAALNLPLARRPYIEPATRHDLGRMEIECSHCRAYHWMDERVSNSSRTFPRFGTCCNHGQVHIQLLREPPAILRGLFDDITPNSLNFRQHIRQYNAALAFTSLGVDIDEGVNDGRGPYVFRIHAVYL